MRRRQETQTAKRCRDDGPLWVQRKPNERKAKHDAPCRTADCLNIMRLHAPVQPNAAACRGALAN